MVNSCESSYKDSVHLAVAEVARIWDLGVRLQILANSAMDKLQLQFTTPAPPAAT